MQVVEGYIWLQDVRKFHENVKIGVISKSKTETLKGSQSQSLTNEHPNELWESQITVL